MTLWLVNQYLLTYLVNHWWQAKEKKKKIFLQAKGAGAKERGREHFFGGASRTPVAEGGGALWKARRSIQAGSNSPG